MKKKGILILAVLLLSITAIFFAKEMQRKLVSNDITSKTEAKVVQSDIKDESGENSKNSDNGKIETADNTNKGAEVKKEETKETIKTDQSKTNQQNSSSKSADTSKQSTEKAGVPQSSNTSNNTSTSTTNNNAQNPSSSSNQNSTSSNQSPNFVVMDEVHNKVICSTRVNFQGKSVADITRETLAKLNISYNYKDGYFRAINGIREQSLDPKTDGWCYYIGEKKPSIGSADFIPQDSQTILWKYVKDGTKP